MYTNLEIDFLPTSNLSAALKFSTVVGFRRQYNIMQKNLQSIPAWLNISERNFRRLVESMPRPVAELLLAKGGPIIRRYPMTFDTSVYFQLRAQKES
ncbi:hypothetical protein AVEN_106328-1 [Araneus ventricosus]|uniref:Uncharacterized protein n=1 Tax=Araneus ventricosus TaxID=182803 RepID=A0A4Y2ASE7_ARAVE|nr:hypothetical protein AVEN_106328-1 [Araneus ventricosus]